MADDRYEPALPSGSYAAKLGRLRACLFRPPLEWFVLTNPITIEATEARPASPLTQAVIFLVAGASSRREHGLFLAKKRRLEAPATVTSQ